MLLQCSLLQSMAAITVSRPLRDRLTAAVTSASLKERWHVGPQKSWQCGIPRRSEVAQWPLVGPAARQPGFMHIWRGIHCECNTCCSLPSQISHICDATAAALASTGRDCPCCSGAAMMR